MTLVSVSQGGLTALIIAVMEGHTETVKTLVAAKADVNLQDEVSKCNVQIMYVYHLVSDYHTFWVPRTHDKYQLCRLIDIPT